MKKSGGSDKDLSWAVAVFSYKNALAYIQSRSGNTETWHLAKRKGSRMHRIPRSEVCIVRRNGLKEDLSLCRDVRVTQDADSYVMTYKRKRSLVWATSSDALTWYVKGSSGALETPAVIAPFDAYEGRRVMWGGDTFIYCATSERMKRWTISDELFLAPREGCFDCVPLRVMGVHTTSQGVLVIYDVSYSSRKRTHVQAGAVLFDRDNPCSIVWRCESPVWKSSMRKTDVRPLGVAFTDGVLTLCWTVKDGSVLCADIDPFVHMREGVRVLPGVHIARHSKNPIISPVQEHAWESEGVFNPAAVEVEGEAHLVYRAVGSSGVSVFGYASSANGYDIDRRLPHPVYVPREPFEGVLGKPAGGLGPYQSGGGWGGCEDPKLTRMGDTIYMTYVAYNGWGPPRAALTSISVDDFLHHRWNWSSPRLISQPDMVTKSACLLPDTVAGRYVMFHRVFPDILIDFLDDLDFDGESRWLEGHERIKIRPLAWDSRKLSVGATPIRTESGWLVIYHAVDDREPEKYKMGAMLLDIHDPSRVLFRTRTPILEPDEQYENEGKPGVVYPCGAVVLDGNLIVYYGGGDRVVCVASAPLDTFVYTLQREKDPSSSFIHVRH